MQEINKERLHTLTNMFLSAISMDPERAALLTQEEEFWAEIANITDTDTANKAIELFHPSKNVYDFNEYLYWLSKLVELFSLGIPPYKAFAKIRVSIVKAHYEPIAILK